MINNSKLVLARVAAEMRKGTPSADVIRLLADIFRRQKEADTAIVTDKREVPPVEQS